MDATPSGIRHIAHLARRAAALRTSSPSTRAARFTARRSGATLPGFAALLAMPNWALTEDSAALERLSNMTGILFFRPQIDQEISGTKLKAVVAAFGEVMFDAACAVPFNDDVTAHSTHALLPRPSQMAKHGETIVADALADVRCGRPLSAGVASLIALAERAVQVLEQNA
jgi:hypothetical protein